MKKKREYGVNAGGGQSGGIGERAHGEREGRGKDPGVGTGGGKRSLELGKNNPGGKSERD